MRRVIYLFWSVLLLTSFALPSGRVQAGCEVDVCGEGQGAPEYCNVFGECEPRYCYACTGEQDVCGPNYHLTPNGGCQENTGGSSCPCGENLQGCKSCQVSCNQTLKVDCPAGSVIDLNQPVGTYCGYDWNGQPTHVKGL